MPDIKITPLPKSEVKLEFTVTPEEAKPYLDEAVKDLSAAKPIPGFRPGKATYEDAKRAFGEMKVWEAALERIVRAFYVRTILDKEIDTVGSPAVSVDQLVPGQAIKFTVTAPVEPKVLQLPDLKKCQVTAKKVEVKDENVNEAVEQIRKMRRAEALVDRAATADDLVVIDLEMKKDQVILEGGSSRDYRVYLSEPHYIPGFAKELVGMKAGEERTFSLPFPSEHFQKHLAGQKVDMTAKAKSVFELKLPELNDEFVKGLGLDSVQTLRDKLKENMSLEAGHKASEAAEIKMLDSLVDQAKFEDVPDLLINQEVRRMMHELEHGVEEQGMKMTDYLSSIKKTSDELKLELVPQANRRVKTAVLIKALAKKEDIKVDDKELDDEVDRVLSSLKPDDKETRERVASPEYREYMAVQLRNRKTLEWLRKECVK